MAEEQASQRLIIESQAKTVQQLSTAQADLMSAVQSQIEPPRSADSPIRSLSFELGSPTEAGPRRHLYPPLWMINRHRLATYPNTALTTKAGDVVAHPHGASIRSADRGPSISAAPRKGARAKR